MDKKFIIVRDDEAELVRAASEIEEHAAKKAATKEEVGTQKYKKVLRDPIEFFDTAEQANIVHERDKLRQLQQKYKEGCKLSFSPVLVPAALTNSAPEPQCFSEIEEHVAEKVTTDEATKKAGKVLQEPIEFFDTAEQANISPSKGSPHKKREETLPSFSPIPTPAALSVPVHFPQHTFEIGRVSPSNTPAQKRDGPPLPEVLKDQFLQVVPVFRDGEQMYLWANGHYRFANKNEVQARIKTVLRAECYVPNPTSLLANIYGMLKTEERIIGQPDNQPNLVAVQNGEVDLRTMTLGPAMPAHRLVHYLDVPWLGPQPCPIFSTFLQQVSGGNAELSQRIIEVIGYLLVQDYGAKKFVVFQGVGDSGKSLLGNLIASFFLPGDCASLADFQFGERFALASIANAQLCLSMDLPDGVIDSKAVSVIKQITGGDALSIEAKGKDAYTGYVRCKLLFGTNNPIRLKTRDHAFANRVLLIPFCHPVPPERQDRGLLEKLKAERPAILYHALHAYRAVVDRGYQFAGEAHFGFTASNIVLETTPTNTVEDFVAQCCTLAPDVFTPTEELHSAYIAFCQQIGCPPITDRSSFSRTLNACLCGQLRQDKQRVNGIPLNGYRGICLKGGDACV